MPHSAIPRITSFLSDFVRRQAARVVDLPGGFAVYDDAFAHSHANNRLIVDGAVAPEALPAGAEEALG
ncbi:GNAT family N-acetyltransferase, partial [Streptomyces sp. SID7760]|nr:GNAT family N-acetyltransferase [Streptomyces sp. SID7760]